MTDTKKTADDLALLDPLADASKDDGELWNELEQAENPNGLTAETSQDTADVDATDPQQGQDDDPAAIAQPSGVTDAQGDDIWADAPDHLKSAYETLKQERDEFENKFKSNNGRISAYQKRIDDLARTAQPSTKTADSAKRASDELKTVAADYPEIAQPVQQALETIEGKIENLSAVEESRQKAAQDELIAHINTETASLTEQIPDWESTLKDNGEKFAAWVEDLPRRMRDIAYRNANHIVDAHQAVELVNAFKDHIGVAPTTEPAPEPEPKPEPEQNTAPLDERRERQLAGSASPKTKGSRPVVSGIPEDDDPQAIWDAFEAEEKAKARA